MTIKDVQIIELVYVSYICICIENYIDLHVEVSINEGTPLAGWFIRENPYLNWMMTGGTPI